MKKGVPTKTERIRKRRRPMGTRGNYDGLIQAGTGGGSWETSIQQEVANKTAAARKLLPEGYNENPDLGRQRRANVPALQTKQEEFAALDLPCQKIARTELGSPRSNLSEVSEGKRKGEDWKTMALQSRRRIKPLSLLSAGLLINTGLRGRAGISTPPHLR